MGEYFVQPVTLRHEGGRRRRGLDNSFTFPTVGMTEYEFGAIPAAARYMRENADEMKNFALNVTGGRGAKAVLICLPKDKKDAENFFRKELKDGYQSSAYLCLRSAFGREPHRSFREPEVAWFSLREDSTWVVCKDIATANLWRQCMTDDPVPLYARLNGPRVEIYYEEAEFQTMLEAPWSPNKDEVFLRAADPKYATFLTHSNSLVARCEPAYSHALFNALQAQFKHQIYAWDLLKTVERTQVSRKIAEGEPRPFNIQSRGSSNG